MKRHRRPPHIVLFFTEDREKRLQAELGNPDAALAPSQMLVLCVESIRRVMPQCPVVLVTDETFDAPGLPDDLTLVRHADIRHGHLMYDRLRVQKQYVDALLEHGEEVDLVFMDIDILLNRALDDVFGSDFDLAFPATFYPDLKYSERGVPLNSLMSIINGGVLFARSSEATSRFFGAWMQQMEYLFQHDALEEYGALKGRVREHFMSWWGEPHTLMVMFGRAFMAGQRKHVRYQGIKVAILEDALYNYAPEIERVGDNWQISVTDQDRRSRFVFHLRGQRKVFMVQLAATLRTAMESPVPAPAPATATALA